MRTKEVLIPHTHTHTHTMDFQKETASQTATGSVVRRTTP